MRTAIFFFIILFCTSIIDLPATNMATAQDETGHKRILEEAGRIVAFALAKKDAQVYLAPENGGVDLWEVEKEKQLKSLKRKMAIHFSDLQLTKDEKLLFVSAGIMLRRVDMKKFELSEMGAFAGIPKMGEFSGEFRSAFVLEPRGRWLILGGRKGGITKHDPRDSRLSTKISTRMGANEIVAMAVDPSSKKLAIGADNHRIRLMTTNNMKWGKELEGHEGAINCLAFDAKGRCLASGATDNFVIVWSPSKGKKIVQISGHDDEVTAVIFHPKSGYLISGDASGLVKVWDWKEATVVKELETQLSRKVEQLSFSRDGKKLFAAGIGNGLVIWDLDKLLN